MNNRCKLLYYSIKLATTLLLALLFTQVSAQHLQAPDKRLNVGDNKAYWKLAVVKKDLKAPKVFSTNNYMATVHVAGNYYTTQTGFFCNQERAFEKKTKIPLRLRLGSLSHTEQLEGY